MNLLRMASERTPAADDLIPVLIYVIIKVSLEIISLESLTNHFFSLRQILHFYSQQFNMLSVLLAKSWKVKSCTGGHSFHQQYNSLRLWNTVIRTMC